MTLEAPIELFLYKNKPVTVVTKGSCLSRIFWEDQTEDNAFSVKTADLKPRPIKKETDVQQALRHDPEALGMFAKAFKDNGGRIEVTTSPSVADQAYDDLSDVSSLSPVDAVDYIRLATDRTHGTKFDILVKDKFPAGLSDRLGVFFHASGLRAKPGEVQINSRPLAEWLMKEHNILPVKVYSDTNPAPRS